MTPRQRAEERAEQAAKRAREKDRRRTRTVRCQCKGQGCRGCLLCVGCGKAYEDPPAGLTVDQEGNGPEGPERSWARCGLYPRCTPEAARAERDAALAERDAAHEELAATLATLRVVQATNATLRERAELLEGKLRVARAAIAEELERASESTNPSNDPSPEGETE